MHVRDERVHRFSHTLLSLIRACDVYVAEMALTGEPAVIRHDFRISSAFPPVTYAKMRMQLLKSFGLDIAPYDRVHPVVLMGMLAQRVLAEDHQVSLDEHLWSVARSAGVPVRGLESVEEQLATLTAIEPLPVCRQLRRLATSPTSLRRQTAAVLRSYMKGDIHGLYQMTRASLRELRKPILVARNRRMVRRIIGLDPTRAHFIAVGAAHLGGARGIIAVLRRLGWRIRPVDPASMPV